MRSQKLQESSQHPDQQVSPTSLSNDIAASRVLVPRSNTDIGCAGISSGHSLSEVSSPQDSFVRSGSSPQFRSIPVFRATFCSAFFIQKFSRVLRIGVTAVQSAWGCLCPI